MPIPSTTVTYTKLLVSLRYYLIGAQMFKALEALEMMIDHQGGPDKFRDDNITLEAQHPLEVTHMVRVLPGLMYPEESIIASLLHDVPEDYPVPHNQIVDQFGEFVGRAVYLLDKNGKQAHHQFGEMALDPIASLVKGADRIRNNDSMVGTFTPEKMVKKTTETQTLILPMISAARKRFPKQEAAYELLAHSLQSQCMFLAEIDRLHQQISQRHAPPYET